MSECGTKIKGYPIKCPECKLSKYDCKTWILGPSGALVRGVQAPACKTIQSLQAKVKELEAKVGPLEVMQTNREAHEEASGMNLDEMFFSVNNIDPDEFAPGSIEILQTWARANAKQKRGEG